MIQFAETYHGGTENIIFQQDGCGPHRANSVRTFLEAKGIELLLWPAQSPDMNPIENVWTILKRKLGQESYYPTSKVDLFNRLLEIQDSISSAYFEKLIASITTRVLTLHKVKGLSTKY